MNENLNLVEILKDCPEDIVLYFTALGEVKFQGIDYNAKECPIDICDCDDDVWVFTKEGKLHNNGDAECALFPSKDQRDWSKWGKHKFDPKTLKPFDRVLVRDRDDVKWVCNYYSFTYDNRFICTGGMGWRYCIPYNDDTKHIVGTSDEAPEYYKYWED